MRARPGSQRVDVEEVLERDPVGLWMTLATDHPEPYPTAFDSTGFWTATAEYTRPELEAAYRALRGELAERVGLEKVWAYWEFERSGAS